MCSTTKVGKYNTVNLVIKDLFTSPGSNAECSGETLKWTEKFRGP